MIENTKIKYEKIQKLLYLVKIILIALQILYFGSSTPKSLLTILKYSNISDKNVIVMYLSEMVQKGGEASHNKLGLSTKSK